MSSEFESFSCSSAAGLSFRDPVQEDLSYNDNVLADEKRMSCHNTNNTDTPLEPDNKSLGRSNSGCSSSSLSDTQFQASLDALLGGGGEWPVDSGGGVGAGDGDAFATCAAFSSPLSSPENANASSWRMHRMKAPPPASSVTTNLALTEKNLKNHNADHAAAAAAASAASAVANPNKFIRTKSCGSSTVRSKQKNERHKRSRPNATVPETEDERHPPPPPPPLPLRISSSALAPIRTSRCNSNNNSSSSSNRRSRSRSLPPKQAQPQPDNHNVNHNSSYKVQPQGERAQQRENRNMREQLRSQRIAQQIGELRQLLLSKRSYSSSDSSGSCRSNGGVVRSSSNSSTDGIGVVEDHAVINGHDHSGRGPNHGPRCKTNKYRTLVSIADWMAQLHTTNLRLEQEHSQLLQTLQQTSRALHALQAPLPSSTTSLPFQAPSQAPSPCPSLTLTQIPAATTSSSVSRENSLFIGDDSEVIHAFENERSLSPLFLQYPRNDDHYVASTLHGHGDDIDNDIGDAYPYSTLDYKAVLACCPAATAFTSIDGRFLDCNVQFEKAVGFHLQKDLLLGQEVASADSATPTTTTTTTGDPASATTATTATPPRMSLFNVIQRDCMESVFVAMSNMLKQPFPETVVSTAETRNGSSSRSHHSNLPSCSNKDVSWNDQDHWMGRVRLVRSPETWVHLCLSLVRGRDNYPLYFSCTVISEKEDDNAGAWAVA